MKMKKEIISLLLAFVLFAFPGLALQITPNQWSYNYDSLQNSTLPSMSFTISNPSNQSIQITPSFSGQISSLYTASPPSIIVAASSVGTLVVQLSDRPSQSGIYISYLDIEGNQIPIVLEATVTPPQSCTLSPLVSSYITKIKSTSNPFTKTFSVIVGEGCTGGLEIQRPILLNTINGDYGEQPISLTGSLSLGKKEISEKASFDLEFNAKGLESTQYNPKVLIIGTTLSGSQIKAEVDLLISVSKTSSPATNITFSDYPTCTLPSFQLQLDAEYNLVCSVKNPSIKVNIPYNENIVGVKVEESGENEDFVWKFRPTKVGEFPLVAYWTFDNLPVGEPQVYNLVVTENVVAGAGESLLLEYYPPKGELQPGDQLSFLVKDNSTRQIVEAKIYINGKLFEEDVLVVEDGKQYTIAVSATGYPALEDTLVVFARPIQLIVSPSVAEVGSLITWSTVPTGAAVYINGVEWTEPSFTPSEPGNFTIKASKERYAETERKVTVETALSLTSFLDPEGEYYIGEELNLNLSKSVEWQVLYSASEGEPPSVMAKATGSVVSFEPTQEGAYRIVGGPKTLATLNITNKPWYKKWMYLVLIVFLVVVAGVWYLNRDGSSGKGNKPLPTEFGLGDVTFGD